MDFLIYAALGLISACFYMKAQTYKRAKTKSLKLLAQITAEKQAVINDIIILAKPLNNPDEQLKVVSIKAKWQATLKPEPTEIFNPIKNRNNAQE